jgi:SAM-dependent methyltransferase
MRTSTEVTQAPAVTRVTACRLCDSRDLDLVVSFTPTPPGDQYVTADKWNKPQPCYPLDVMICRGCGAVQLADTVDPALIYTNYLYTTSVSRGLDKHFEDYADSVMARVQPQTGAFVVDIGSNDGTLLKAFEKRDCAVVGVEPAEAIAFAANGIGVATCCGWFTERFAQDIRHRHGPADIITANHVMANVADLHDFIRGVKHLLAPDGTFVFETGYWPAIVNGNLIDTIEHEHIHYFAVTPLQNFFASHGLTLIHAELNGAKGGSIRGYVRHSVNAQPDASVAMMVSVSAEGYKYGQTLDIWARELKDLEQRIANVVSASQSETWVGYGAAVGSTLQLYQFGLGERLKFLVDDNPQKQGRLSPGFHLQVRSPEELKRQQPDRIVILAWRYADMIKQQHPEFSGKFLTLLPEMVTA